MLQRLSSGLGLLSKDAVSLARLATLELSLKVKDARLQNLNALIKEKDAYMISRLKE